MTNPKHTDTSRSGDLVERLRALHVWPQAVADGHADLLTPRQIDKLYEVGRVSHEAADRIEALEAENERLREALEAVWKEATTMRNASKLIGPYPKEPANNRVWARSMYHAGKKLHELIKPVRAALGEKQ